MNLMFRKNFRTEKERTFSSGFTKKPPSHGKRSRESGYTVMAEQHYRTHIFMNPPGKGDPMFSEDEPKRSSISLMKWGSGGKADARRKKPLPETEDPRYAKQVSFRAESGYTTNVPMAGTPQAKTPEEPVTLATLNRDCFIIPVANLDRFLPAGVTLPKEKRPNYLNVLEVDDPKLCVLMHLMTPMQPIEPILESPLARPLTQQKSAANEILDQVGTTKTAMEGMILSNMEKNAEFPFIAYYVINKSQTDPVEFFRKMRHMSFQKFDPKTLRYTAVHMLDLYNEVATIARPPLDPSSKRPQSQSTGYIISVYKVFEGDDGEKFEKNWLYWTGARMLYRYLPKSVGLRRITLHKSLSNGDKLYLLMCECSNFLDDLSAAALLIPALRARLCGYTGIYRMTSSF